MGWSDPTQPADSSPQGRRTAADDGEVAKHMVGVDTGCGCRNCCRRSGIRVDTPHRGSFAGRTAHPVDYHCGESDFSPAEVAAAAVKISMQRKLDSDPDLKELGLTVVEVILVNRSGNEFKGIATVKESDGEEHDVPVNVTSDTDNTLWETPPGAFVFAHEQPAPSPTAAITRPALGHSRGLQGLPIRLERGRLR